LKAPDFPIFYGLIQNIAFSLKLIKIKEVLKLLKKVPKELIEISDLVTEFKEIKHYFKKGILAQKGREF
jgi:cob(I)alamin adenosyltransferase